VLGKQEGDRKRKSLILQVEFGKIIGIERTELCLVNS
jgi:hypothetical protein